MRMTLDTNTNGKTETKNTKFKIRDSKMRKKNRKTKMDSKKHGAEEGREGRKEEKKTKDWLLQQRTYDDSKTRAAMENVRILGTSHVA